MMSEIEWSGIYMLRYYFVCFDERVLSRQSDGACVSK